MWATPENNGKSCERTLAIKPQGTYLPTFSCTDKDINLSFHVYVLFPLISAQNCDENIVCCILNIFTKFVASRVRLKVGFVLCTCFNEKQSTMVPTCLLKMKEKGDTQK